MKLPFTIQIPVFNETRALEFSAHFFRQIGLRPRYVLDAKHTQDAATVLRRTGHEAITYVNDKPFIEHGYEAFARVAPTDWILRLDCDELPSWQLLEAAREFVVRDVDGVMGFEREQLLWRRNRFARATDERFQPARQLQWRLFNRARVAFDRTIHTSGLVLDRPMRAPPEARLYHLSWVFLSWEDRLRKAARYDAEGQKPFNRANQLFRLEDTDWEDSHDPMLRRIYAAWLRRQRWGDRMRRVAGPMAGWLGKLPTR